MGEKQNSSGNLETWEFFGKCMYDKVLGAKFDICARMSPKKYWENLPNFLEDFSYTVLPKQRLLELPVLLLGSKNNLCLKTFNPLKWHKWPSKRQYVDQLLSPL